MNTTHKTSYDAGYDAGFNGVSMRNSHYGFFGSPEATKAWEKGKEEGDADRLLVDAGAKAKYARKHTL